MISFQTLGDMLMRRYATDMIASMQNLSSPIFSQIGEDTQIVPSGEGAYFAIRLDGNETGGGWRAAEDNTLPTSGSERIKQARVRPKKYYRVVAFSGLSEAVSQRGGEDAFASAITDAVSTSVRRAGADYEVALLRSDGTGRLASVSGGQTSSVITVDDARAFRAQQLVVFLNPSTGLKTAGPVTILSRSFENSTITLSGSVTVSNNDGVYIAGEQSEASPPAEVQMLGLPALINNVGMIYNVSRTTYPILQSKIIDAGATALDDSMLRRLRRRILIDSDVQSMDGFVMVSSFDQFDRYSELALPFRRFNDMKLDLGANQSVTTFEGRPWLLSWAIRPNVLYQLNMEGVKKGVLRPLSIDSRINMQWIPGQDAFVIVMKAYLEMVARMLNQTGAITNLSTPTY